MWLIGDIHGDVAWWLRAVAQADAAGVSTLQLGDFGFGCKALDHMIESMNPADPNQHKFIRGNHDKPLDAEVSPHYLGDYGYIPELDLFYVSGAKTPDWAKKIENLTWWQDEELSYGQMQKCLDFYRECSPRFVVTHDCPRVVSMAMYPKRTEDPHSGMTGHLLQEMFDSYKPEAWFYGHHHRDFEVSIEGTQFKCLDIGEVVNVPEMGNWNSANLKG